MADTKTSYTWAGKGLRLIDLLDGQERAAVLGAFPSERQFRAQHLVGDATEFMRHAERHGLLDEVEDIMTRKVHEKTLEGMNLAVVRAMDGRFEVAKLGDLPPIRGSIPPGSRTETQIAYDYLTGLAAQGQQPAFPVTQKSQKPVFVSPQFAEYLREIGEPVQSVPRDREGSVSFVWPARHDQQLDRVLRGFHLATLGCNEPDAGELGKVIALKTPKQYAIWKTGQADQWRMMDSLREVLLGAAQTMTSGAYADERAGGALSDALRSFQRAYQSMADAAVEKGRPSQRAAQELSAVADSVVAAATYLDRDAPVRESALQKTLLDAVDLASTIRTDVTALYERHLQVEARRTTAPPSPASGLS